MHKLYTYIDKTYVSITMNTHNPMRKHNNQHEQHVNTCTAMQAMPGSGKGRPSWSFSIQAQDFGMTPWLSLAPAVDFCPRVGAGGFTPGACCCTSASLIFSWLCTCSFSWPVELHEGFGRFPRNKYTHGCLCLGHPQKDGVPPRFRLQS